MKNNVAIIAVMLLSGFTTIKTMVNPGQNIQSPTEIIQEIEEFKKRVAQKPEDPKEQYAADQMAMKALWAYYLCDQYLTGGQSFSSFVDNYQAVTRDPMRYGLFMEQYPHLNNATSKAPWLALLEEECQTLREDCSSCSDHQKKLKEYIDRSELKKRFINFDDIWVAVRQFRNELAAEGDQCLYRHRNPKEYAEGAYKAQNLLLNVLYAYYTVAQQEWNNKAQLDAICCAKKKLKKEIEALQGLIIYKKLHMEDQYKQE